MKFKTGFSVALPENVLKSDYQGADKYGKISLGDSCLYITHIFYVEYVPYSVITKAFRRIEDVKGKLCCGVSNYEIHHLVLEENDKSITVLFEEKEAAQKALEQVAEKNPETVIGCRQVVETQAEAAECPLKNNK